jgi:hypothetical protein
MPNRVLVDGMPLGVARSELEGLFTAHGKILAIRIFRDSSWVTSFAEVEMSDAISAQRAAEALHHSRYQGHLLLAFASSGPTSVEVPQPGPDPTAVAPRCTYCSTVMLYWKVGPASSAGLVEWICPSCKSTKASFRRPELGGVPKREQSPS